MSIVVKLNGTFSHILSVLEPEKALKESDGFWDWINDAADGFISTEVSWFLKPLGLALKDGVMGIIHLLNTFSAEIITLGIIAGAIGMIIAPLMGSTSARWFGRVVFVSLVGSVWRLITV
jgi:hypothetical protein